MANARPNNQFECRRRVFDPILMALCVNFPTTTSELNFTSFLTLTIIDISEQPSCRVPWLRSKTSFEEDLIRQTLIHDFDCTGRRHWTALDDGTTLAAKQIHHRRRLLFEISEPFHIWVTTWRLVRLRYSHANDKGILPTVAKMPPSAVVQRSPSIIRAESYHYSDSSGSTVVMSNHQPILLRSRRHTT